MASNAFPFCYFDHISHQVPKILNDKKLLMLGLVRLICWLFISRTAFSSERRHHFVRKHIPFPQRVQITTPGHLEESKLNQLKKDDSIPPSIVNWDSIQAKNRVSILSMTVEHRREGNWYVPSLHEKFSVGWNRTVERNYRDRPIACNLRFYGLGLESTLENFVDGGDGFITVYYVDSKGRKQWHGFGGQNDTVLTHCYYMTNKHYGSEFLDNPKTLGVAVYCPITLDQEAGEYVFRHIMQPGYFCRGLAEYSAEVELHLRPSQVPAAPHAENGGVQELMAHMVTTPQGKRLEAVKEMQQLDYRPHAVCTVQTFRNSQTGIMLYLFAAYHLKMGWRVIIYDRFGLHREYLESLLSDPGMHYHPYTVYQLAHPEKYNEEFAKKQGFGYKYFYKMEKDWGYKGQQADTADQDQDKSKTYDLCRLEYDFLDMILYVDADELFYCPQASKNPSAQRHFQQKMMSEYCSLGVEEMRFVRIPYSGRAPADFPRNGSRDETDFTNNTATCMEKAYAAKDMMEMFKCWSSATAYDNFPKSADMAGKCPFHYNHWSCDGMKGGGRDLGQHKMPRCRCKVAVDLFNGYEFRPMLHKCHLLHLNDNKYRFQSRREKHQFDHGDVHSPCPVVGMLLGPEDGERK